MVENGTPRGSYAGLTVAQAATRQDVTIVRSCGPILGAHASVQSHVTNLRVRRILTKAVDKYELM